MRLDGKSDGKVDDKVDEGLQGTELPQPAVLERVATVDSKDAGIEPRMLKEYRKGWEMRQTYKRLRPSEGWKDAGRRDAKERGKLQRYMITSAFRDLSATTTTTTSSTAEDSKTAAAASSNSKNSNKETEQGETEEELEYYDTQIRCGQEDIITCNGEPMTSEKFVYDLYYYPHKMDWTEFVCEQNKFIADENEEEDEEEDEDEDENAESNWRNEYPEEEDDEDEEDDMDDYDYIERPRMRRGLLKCGSDESFDLEQYEEDEDEVAFDEFGNIVYDSVASLGSRLACTGLSSSDESD